MIQKDTALYNNSFDVDFEVEGGTVAVTVPPSFLIIEYFNGHSPQFIATSDRQEYLYINFYCCLYGGGVGVPFSESSPGVSDVSPAA